MSAVSFGDLVRLKDSRVGTVRFIGRTTVKKTIFYGIQLKVKTGEHNGCIHSRRFFKCNDKYGIFVERSDIKKVIKHHTVAASYHYDQSVMVSDYGVGQIKYIGMIHTDHGLWYGVELDQPSTQPIENNEFVQNLFSNDIEKYLYFEADTDKGLFVRVNMLKSVRNREFRRKAVLDESKQSVSKKKERKKELKIAAKRNDGYNEYINKTFIQMMDKLDIPQKSRPRMLKMDDSRKLLLIQQWFITPNNQSAFDDIIVDKEQCISPKKSVSDNVGFDGCELSKAPVHMHKRKKRKNKSEKNSNRHKEYKKSKKKRKMMRIIVHKASQSLIEYKKPPQKATLKMKKASSVKAETKQNMAKTKGKAVPSKDKGQKKKNNIKKSASAGSISQYLKNKMTKRSSSNSLKPKKSKHSKSNSAALLNKKTKSKTKKKETDTLPKSLKPKLKRVKSNSASLIRNKAKSKNANKPKMKATKSLNVKSKHNKSSSAALGKTRTKKVKKAKSAASLDKYSNKSRKNKKKVVNAEVKKSKRTTKSKGTKARKSQKKSRK